MADLNSRISNQPAYNFTNDMNDNDTILDNEPTTERMIYIVTICVQIE